MVLIGKAVLKRAGTAFKSFYYPWSYNHATKRRISAGRTFAECDHVRHNIPVIDSEGCAGASHAGHYFIGDEQHVMVAADISNALNVAIGRHRRAQSRADDRFKNKCRDGLLAVVAQKGLQLLGASKLAFRKTQSQWTMPAKAWINVSPLRQQRLVGRATGHVSAHGHGAQRASVITLPTADHAKTLWPAALNKILARQLEGGFIGFRSAGTEIDAPSAAYSFRSHSKKPRRKLFR